jgi:hypothetical protein
MQLPISPYLSLTGVYMYGDIGKYREIYGDIGKDREI